MRATSVLLTLLLSVAAAAREYAPRVVSDQRADAYSMKTFAQFPRWKDLRGDALAWEVYRYLADTRSGVFHMNEVLEGHDVLSEYRTVRDPVKAVNVYGYAYCAAFGPIMAGVWEDMGQGPARTLSLPGWSHVVTEVSYDGAWHYVDLDVRAVFRRDDGRLASLDEARRDASLWKDREPLFFPNDPLDKTRQVYQRTSIDPYHGFNQGGHTMDYVLRQGETFIRWWKPQGGRWHHAPEYNREDWLRRLIEQEPRGPKPNHRHFTVHNHGNGRFTYRPNLTARSTDFGDGAYDARNVKSAADGLRLVEPGEGHAIFEVRSPYIIVPLVGSLTTTEDDREASVVEIDAKGATLALSLDNGLTWRDVDAAEGKADAARSGATIFDLTRHVSGTYGYLLRIALRGRPDAAVVRGLGITTWVQVAPAALPALHKGKNRLEYRTGDHYGLNTRVVEIRSEANRPEELLKYLAEPPRDYDPARKTGRIRGAAVAKVEAPPGAKIAWFTAEGSFATHQREAARNTRNTISFAADGQDFREIYRADVPTDTAHWHCNAHREVKLEQPAARLLVRYVGDPALNNIHIYAHCLDDVPRSARGTVITHSWDEGSTRRVRGALLQGAGPYEIDVAAEPGNESIEIAVPSDPPAVLQGLAVEADDYWVAAMKAVHQKFKGERGTFAQFGDSITVSKAFWFGLKYAPKNASPEMQKALTRVKDYMLDECWDGKGADRGNEGQMTIRWAHQNVDKWLKALNPEVALMMFGTNDVGSLELKEYEAKTREVVQKCLDNGTILILSTIPPKHGQADKAAAFSEAVRKIAREMKVPLTDYHAEILSRRPDDWDGAAKQFSEYRDYDVPTLLSRDGVHPSNPKKYVNDFSEEGLRSNGFGLRSYLALVKYAEVIEKVLPKKPAVKDAPQRTLFFQDFEGQGDWDGSVTDKDAPAANKHVLEARSGDEYFGRKLRVGMRKPPVAAAQTTYLSFDYFLEGSDFLQVFLFDLDINDNCRYAVDPPVTGKWTTHTVKVTGPGKLKQGHKVDDIFFFAGPPGSKKTRLMIDNVRLSGSD